MINKLQLKDAYRLLHYGTLAFARAERQGFRLDVDRAQTKKKELTETIDQLTEEVKQSKFYRHWEHSRGSHKVNMDSNPQLSSFLYKVKKLKPIKLTKTGKGSTDEEALEALNIKELNIILRIRKLKKLRDTYLEGYLREVVNGYIHPFFNLLARSFRSSCDSPNIQNVPIRDKESKEIIRGCLLPRPGHQLLELDFKGIEVSVSCCVHKDPTMINYVENPKSNMHTDLAKEIFKFKKFDANIEPFKTFRSAVKNGFVFPQFYGDYYGNNALSLSRWTELPVNKKWNNNGLILPNGIYLSQHLKNKKIGTLKSFTQHLKDIEDDFWNERFRVYNDWKQRWWKQYQKKGYFDMLTGFRCSGVYDKKQACNYPIQGPAFHCDLWLFNEVDRIMRKEKWDTKLLGQVHDSIIFDLNPDEKEHVIETVFKGIKELMRIWDWLIVPLRIDAEICEIDQPWSAKKELKI